MKKTIVKIIALVFVVSAVLTGFTACTPRSRTLRIYNWGDYMDETVVDSFKAWYEEEYGEKIKVKYSEFVDNENVYTAIATKGEDWDLICPSDYTVERMIKEDLLYPVDKNVIDVSKEGFMSDTLLEIFGGYDEKMEYMVPYIWGTFGIMYDTSDELFKNNAANVEKLNSWAALWDPAFSGKVSMKNSERDSYTVAALYHHRNELKTASVDFTDYTTKAYDDIINDIFSKYTLGTIEQAKTDLVAQSDNMSPRYEVDEGKMEMADGTGPKLGLYWSCDAGFAMNDYESANSKCSNTSLIEGNKNLKYVVPKEGSNVWVDAWVIPKTSKNRALANQFLKFIMQDEICMLNSSYAGAPSANAKAMEELEKEISADTEFFAGTYEGFKEMYLEMMFPTDKTLLRCRAMHDFGDLREEISDMWATIRKS